MKKIPLKSGNEKIKQEDTNSEESLISIAKSLEDLSKKYSSSDEKLNKTENRFWTSKTISIISVLINAVLVFVTFLLWHEAGKQIDISKQNYIEENRPYVFPDIPSMHPSYGILTAYLPIHNYGHTPAYKVNICVSFQCGDSIPDPKKFIYDSTWTWMTLAPNSVDTMIFLQDKEHWFVTPTAKPCLVGKIWYNDAWSNRLHYTTFAYKLLFSYGGRFTRQFEYESVDRYDENQDKTK
jgi:hypothetical protein